MIYLTYRVSLKRILPYRQHINEIVNKTTLRYFREEYEMRSDAVKNRFELCLNGFHFEIAFHRTNFASPVYIGGNNKFYVRKSRII